jgi:hypothetical protein
MTGIKRPEITVVDDCPKQTMADNCERPRELAKRAIERLWQNNGKIVRIDTEGAYIMASVIMDLHRIAKRYTMSVSVHERPGGVLYVQRKETKE